MGAVIAFPLGVVYRKHSAEATLGSAEEEAKRLISDAIKASESKKKEAIVSSITDARKNSESTAKLQTEMAKEETDENTVAAVEGK